MSEEEERKWAGLRAKTTNDLRHTWLALSKNRLWKSLLRRRKLHNPNSRSIFEVWFDFLQHEISQIWIDDIF